MATTALIRYQDRWAVEDPVLDYIIQRHEIVELNELVDAFMDGWGDDEGDHGDEVLC